LQQQRLKELNDINADILGAQTEKKEARRRQQEARELKAQQQREAREQETQRREARETQQREARETQRREAREAREAQETQRREAQEAQQREAREQEARKIKLFTFKSKECRKIERGFWGNLMYNLSGEKPTEEVSFYIDLMRYCDNHGGNYDPIEVFVRQFISYYTKKQKRLEQELESGGCGFFDKFRKKRRLKKIEARLAVMHRVVTMIERGNINVDKRMEEIKKDRMKSSLAYAHKQIAPLIPHGKTFDNLLLNLDGSDVAEHNEQQSSDDVVSDLNGSDVEKRDKRQLSPNPPSIFKPLGLSNKTQSLFGIYNETIPQFREKLRSICDNTTNEKSVERTLE
jgi:hypothetical protein